MNGGDAAPPAPYGGMGSRIAPPRFVAFTLLMPAIALGWHLIGGHSWGDSAVIGFDAAAAVFIVSLWPLLRDHHAEAMRVHAAQNDANRGWVLVITILTALTILAAIGAEMPAARQGQLVPVVKLVGTLAMAWVFTNIVFMLHYAHMHYAPDVASGTDAGGFEFPGTPEPDYWDFLYFSFTAGMSFAASDVDVTRGAVRRIVMVHSLLSFVFNIGVLAFSINVLAGATG